METFSIAGKVFDFHLRKIKDHSKSINAVFFLNQENIRNYSQISEKGIVQSS